MCLPRGYVNYLDHPRSTLFDRDSSLFVSERFGAAVADIGLYPALSMVSNKSWCTMSFFVGLTLDRLERR